MDDKKKKRLAALKAETSKNVAKQPLPQKEKLDLWDELALNRPVIKGLPIRLEAESRNAVAAPTVTAVAPIPIPAVIAPAISPKPEPVKQQPIAAPAERTRIYRWPDGYYLANGKLIDPADTQYANAERFKIFKPPSGWIAKTEDGTNREYKIEVAMDVWDHTELKRMNKILSHDREPIISSPYNGVR